MALYGSELEAEQRETGTKLLVAYLEPVQLAVKSTARRFGVVCERAADESD